MPKKSNASSNANPSPKPAAKPLSSRHNLAKKGPLESAGSTPEIAAAVPVDKDKKSARVVPAPVAPEKRSIEPVPVVKAIGKIKPVSGPAPVSEPAMAKPAESEVSERRREIGREDISRLAFSYFAERGYRGGSPEEDWWRAERELFELKP